MSQIISIYGAIAKFARIHPTSKSITSVLDVVIRVGKGQPKKASSNSGAEFTRLRAEILHPIRTQFYMVEFS